MHDVQQTGHGSAKDSDPGHEKEHGRKRDDGGVDGGGVNPTLPQRGGDGSSEPAQRRSGVRGDPSLDGGGVNPGPPQRDGDDQQAGGALPGHRDDR